MPTFVALLRAVNVGGTGKLPMADLKAMCVAEGFGEVETYIASGNVVFTADRSAREAGEALEKRLRAYAGKPVGVFIRTAEEIADVLDANPFADTPLNWTYTIFLNDAPPADTLETVLGRMDEASRKLSCDPRNRLRRAVVHWACPDLPCKQMALRRANPASALKSAA
ncbi:DUF1697 domain-containing protein [Zavarzinia compransoris]|uniref:DUF1697 domain-containing protein n=1 Tax=Zavarzinia marina TaxID=2911065 RepID=UPI001F490C37|nr:DUF1697 domain-containing protein [Zavarzinia marina]MCF4167344.1 DUF1697 domain-containing protein [Zavarzinia marina]